MPSTELRKLQQSFFGHLVGEQTDVVKHIQSTVDRSAEQRLHIYSSGYRLRLKEAISTDLDKLYSYLGDEMFEHLMDVYIDTYQSHHPSLRYYSQNMCELLATQKPFSDFPELLELARIEQAFNFSFDAADCDTIGIESIAKIQAESWAELTIQFHSSMQLLELQKNTFPVWKALSQDQTPPESVFDASTWMIWRKQLVSRFRVLDEAEAALLREAKKGANFSRLCEAMLSFSDEEQAPMQVITLLQTWINEQLVCHLS